MFCSFSPHDRDCSFSFSFQQEMALPSHKFEAVGDENLEKNWKHVGSGGFGHVYRARHKVRGHDVAIKILDTRFW